MGDFFAFRRMLAPVLIHIMFWLSLIGFTLLVEKLQKFHQLSALVIGPRQVGIWSCT